MISSVFFSLNYLTFAYSTFNFVRFSCCLLIFYFIITVIFVFTQISCQLHLRFISLHIFHHSNVRLKTSRFSHEFVILVIIYYVLRCLCFEFTLLFSKLSSLFSLQPECPIYIYFFSTQVKQLLVSLKDIFSVFQLSNQRFNIFPILCMCILSLPYMFCFQV